MHQEEVRHVEQERHPADGDQDLRQRPARPTQPRERHQGRIQSHQQVQQRRRVLAQVEERHHDDIHFAVEHARVRIAVDVQPAQQHEAPDQHRAGPPQPAGVPRVGREDHWAGQEAVRHDSDPGDQRIQLEDGRDSERSRHVQREPRTATQQEPGGGLRGTPPGPDGARYTSPMTIPTLRRVTAGRYVQPLREGGSLPAVVDTDGGLYVVKFRGAGQGPRALVAELLVGLLAARPEPPTPEPALVDVPPPFGRSEPDPEIQDLLRRSNGLNVGLRYLDGAFNFDPPAAAELVPSEFAARLVWLDALVTNPDRSHRNPNLLIWQR